MPRRAPAMGGSRVIQSRIAPGHSSRCQRVTKEWLLETELDREVPNHRRGAAGVRGVTGCAGVGGDGDPTATDANVHLGSRALLADPDVDAVAGCRYANRGACDVTVALREVSDVPPRAGWLPPASAVARSKPVCRLAGYRCRARSAGSSGVEVGFEEALVGGPCAPCARPCFWVPGVWGIGAGRCSARCPLVVAASAADANSSSTAATKYTRTCFIVTPFFVDVTVDIFIGCTMLAARAKVCSGIAGEMRGLANATSDFGGFFAGSIARTTPPTSRSPISGWRSFSCWWT